MLAHFAHKHSREKRGEDNPSLDDAQAPGLPTEEDGYKPPKNWSGGKVKHPKTGQYGYPVAHGGPHWDVIGKKGTHINVMPGGKIRG